MKKIIISMIFLSLLRADILNDFLNKKYDAICSYRNITKYLKDDKILSIIGLSCLKLDKLYMLPYIVSKLKHTSNGRKNGIYFLTIYTQKKLLYSYFFDNFSLDAFKLPKTDYVLSKVFCAVRNNEFKKIGDKILIKDKNKTYYVYKNKDKFFIDEYINNKFIKRRWYR